MRMTPLVSVIVPAWNAAAFIQYAVRSALDQTLQDIEVLVVDDASRDDTRATALAAAHGDPRLRVLALESNAGPAAARNAGLAAARGAYVAILDADDRMRPTRLATMLERMRALEADLAFDNLWRCPEPDSLARAEPLLAPMSEPERLSLAGWVRGNRLRGSNRLLGFLKPMARRAFLLEQGLGYDPTLRIAEDYQFVAEALARGARAWLLPEADYFYWQRGDSLSKRPRAADLAAMLGADAQFQARWRDRLSRAEADALRARRTGIERLSTYLTVRERLLARDPAAAARALLGRPTAALFVWGAVRHRLGLRA